MVKTTQLEHKIRCWGFRVEDEKQSIVFITDTLPTEQSIAFAEIADHFIHEATFTDNHSELAGETKHTTISQAIEIGEKAGVKHIYLTHFSPRIEDEELLKLEQKYNFIGLQHNQKLFI